ncbi:WhiB family transcriptional regulator [Luteipulveratus mongoliensis]|uniref:Transcriptional regulator WhiB n=1 Tax=Luteipulveratus mongoliensis TaxID=571913 RepID=A0A0K1JND4_9MICO|nr:WhiB family transcriptional regulator [Luteipulveratus mongoliensis]AKU18105.1 hypothetical protein VV02_23285 [Luteipulveratus mongoliensis]
MTTDETIADFPELPQIVADNASCKTRDPDLWFPVRRVRRELVVQYAATICAGCPVLDECREWAINAPDQYGIWGGLDRIELRRRRAARAGGAGIEDVAS